MKSVICRGPLRRQAWRMDGKDRVWAEKGGA